MTLALRYVEVQARRYGRVWKASVFSNFVTPVLFLAGMGLGLGGLVDESRANEFWGHGYLAFLAPGLLAATAMQTAASESAWPVLGAIKWDFSYQAALATPVSVTDLVLGHLLWVAVRLTLVCGAFAVVTVFFGASTLASALLSIAPAVLTGLAFASPITALAGSLTRDNNLSIMFRFVITPLFLFSGTFFPISQLPEAMQPIAFAVPLWHGVELTRHAALATPLPFPALVHVAYLVLWLGAGTWLSLIVFHRRLRP